ncbi:sulfite exporter TauE/SafE family protein [soil metagenome]
MGITPSTLLAIVLSTFLIGIILGFIGAGGAGVLLGLLSGVFDLPIGQAIGTALAAMCVVTVSGAVSHFREGNVVWRIGLIVGASGVAGAAIGATLSQDVSDTILRLGAGLALWALALLVWIRTRFAAKTSVSHTVEDDKTYESRDIGASVALGLSGGISAGFFGVGMAPYLQLGFLSFHRLTLRQTIGTTMWALVFISASAAVVLARHGDVSWPHLVGSVVGLSLGSYCGAKLTARAPVRVLRIAVVVVPFVAGAMVIFL